MSSMDTRRKHYTLRHGERLLVDGDELFLPALWTGGEQWIPTAAPAPRTRGRPRKVGRGECEMTVLTADRTEESRKLPIRGGRLRIELNPEQAAVLRLR